jgi:exopolyphosphatase/guanosine-5'-triphosphate,3'-diphosphate pyrophosphatase
MRAAIDLGTNSLRAIIVNDLTEPLHILYEKGFIVRVGEGINEDKRLNIEAKHRTLKALFEIKAAFDRWGVGPDDYRFVATSALRDAEDGPDFIEEVRQLGLHMTIISGIDEAKIIAKAVNAFVPERNDHALFVDQGGGSVEFIHHQKEHETFKSLDIGIVRLSERFFPVLPPSKEAVLAYTNFLTKTFHDELQDLIDAAPDQLIIIGGTGATLAKLFLKLDVFDSLKIHGKIIPKRFVDEMIQVLMPLTPAEIANQYGLDAKRADVFTAGVIEIACLMNTFNFSEALVSDRGLRYGLLLPE